MEQTTVHIHLMGPNVTVEARQDATGRVFVEIQSGWTDVSMTVASQVGQTGLYTDPARLADELEAAAKSLRILTRPVDAGDHFRYDSEEAARWAAEEALSPQEMRIGGLHDVPIADQIAPDFAALVAYLEDPNA